MPGAIANIPMAAPVALVICDVFVKVLRSLRARLTSSLLQARDASRRCGRY